MKDCLLDTHTAIWYFEGNNAISETAKKIISDDSISKYLSIASAWEVAIKINIGKLTFTDGVVGFLRTAQNNRIAILPIESNHLAVYETLPMYHRDPFDRLLIATAIVEDMSLVTGDRNISMYGVSHIW